MATKRKSKRIDIPQVSITQDQVMADIVAAWGVANERAVDERTTNEIAAGWGIDPSTALKRLNAMYRRGQMSKRLVYHERHQAMAWRRIDTKTG